MLTSLSAFRVVGTVCFGSRFFATMQLQKSDRDVNRQIQVPYKTQTIIISLPH